MKPPAFACKEFIRAEIFQPSEDISQDQRQHDSHCSCHLTASLEVNPSSGKRICHFALKTKVKEIFKPAQGMKMFEVDFQEANKDEQAPSHVDRKFMKLKKGFIIETTDTTNYHFHSKTKGRCCLTTESWPLVETRN